MIPALNMYTYTAGPGV